MYEVSEQVLIATLNYLATRPYQEVAELITVLRQSKKIEPKKEANETDNKPQKNNQRT